MAIFFGVNFPTIELLLVMSVVQIIGLTFTLIVLIVMVRQLKQFRLLLQEEKQDLNLFEHGLKELEKFKKDEEHREDELKKYIESTLVNGHDWAKIREALIANGWKEELIDQTKQKLEQEKA